MADKKLLEEATIRRFMKLANIAPTEKGVLSEGTVKVKMAGGAPNKNEARFAGSGEAVAGLREEESWMKEADEEEAAPEADAGDMGGMAGDDMGAPAEGGDLESAVESVVDALNGLLAAAGMEDKEVELDSGSKEGGEEASGMEDDGMEPPMAEAKKEKGNENPVEEEKVEEDLEESIELVDDTLIEKLVQRVSARLVAEARKLKESKLAEGKKGGGAKWGAKPPAARKQTVKGHGAGKGNKSTPYSKSVSVKGTAGRGR